MEPREAPLIWIQRRTSGVCWVGGGVTPGNKHPIAGRLVEQTCRELETKDMETAVHLQRELSEVLCKYQLATLRKS